MLRSWKVYLSSGCVCKTWWQLNDQFFAFGAVRTPLGNRIVMKTGQIYSLTRLLIICIYKHATILRKTMSVNSRLKKSNLFSTYIPFVEMYLRPHNFLSTMKTIEMNVQCACRKNVICFPFMKNASVLSPLTLIIKSNVKR